MKARSWLQIHVPCAINAFSAKSDDVVTINHISPLHHWATCLAYIRSLKQLPILHFFAVLSINGRRTSHIQTPPCRIAQTLTPQYQKNSITSRYFHPYPLLLCFIMDFSMNSPHVLPKVVRSSESPICPSTAWVFTVSKRRRAFKLIPMHRRFVSRNIRPFIEPSLTVVTLKPPVLLPKCLQRWTSGMVRGKPVAIRWISLLGFSFMDEQTVAYLLLGEYCCSWYVCHWSYWDT